MANFGRSATLLLPVAGLTLLMGGLGCKNGGDSGSSSSTMEAPLAAKDPGDILQHLRYLSATRDTKDLILIAPVSPDIVFPSAWWFHSQARNLGIELSDEELKTLGITALKDRLDNLPRAPEGTYDIAQARLTFNAGIYRLVKGFSPDEWAKMYIMDVRPSPSNLRVMDVTLGFDSQPKIVVSCIRTGGEGSPWGIANFQYKVGIRKKK